MNMTERVKLWLLKYAGELRVDDIDTYLGMARNFEKAKNDEMDITLKEIADDPSLTEEEKDEYRWHIEGMYDDAGGAVDIAYSMAIVTLYSRVEVARKKIVKCVFSDLKEKKLSDMRYINSDVLPLLPEVAETSSLTELRLINNSIKHTDSKVSKELSRLSGYVEGDLLRALNNTYTRLLPDAVHYISKLSDAAKKHVGS
ncbi:hypothetical protein [Granulosicoccus antarcticus]|uniref:Uncharacterized protein n=1 Tax=Granulosicoccus antarcticus IMCC3135 TaxID=1192854 RepID=A0A2Z2NL08_9GAMM|nr:hypothetical protein [Granulosicoccus antarcticus]ASJ72112.1 hypothetical protein IMCC3135_10090 [Granulosicoccus antarcticus IMCC3135]